MRSWHLLGPIEFSLIIRLEFPPVQVAPEAAAQVTEHSGEEALTPTEFEVLQPIAARRL